MKTIDARENRERIEEFKNLIVNDNCAFSQGVEVLLNDEKAARKLSLYTSILGYENRVEAAEDGWAMKVEVGPCVCPVGV
jgi:hypothetical protein